MALYRRDVHVVEVQVGAHVRRPEDACGPAHFNRTAAAYVTLVSTYAEGYFYHRTKNIPPASSPETRQCPYSGRFSISMSTRSVRSLRKRWRHTQVLPRTKRVDREPCGRFTALVIGCSSADTMDFYSDCDAVSCKGLRLAGGAFR